MLRLSLCSLVLCLMFAANSGAAPSVNKIAAVVNGEMITHYDLVATTAPAMLRAGVDPKNPAHQEKLQAIQRAVLEDMIMEIIIGQEAERLKVAVTPPEVEREIKATKDRMKLTDEEFNKQLKLQGLTDETLRDRMRKNLLKNKLLTTMVARKVVVTKEEVEQYYKDRQGAIPTGDTVRFALIIYPPNANAEALGKRVESGSQSFESVAREMSIGPKAEAGGDVGEMPWQDVAPVVREKLMSLKEGQISPLFPLENFKAQVKLLSSGGQGASKQVELDDRTRAQIENVLREPKLQERYTEYTDQLRKRARVDVRL